ncbi:MAG: alkaline phosphatase family protein [Streptosporangiales bacterium]|nr:alkaline phosphatase family protein [Streptosporangiales bacterium]
MPELALGPLLRHVDDTTAAVWVETDAPCTVRVLHASTPTFTVHGHHYALVEIDGLEPGASVPYSVQLDGVEVWPPRDGGFPPSRIHTVDAEPDVQVLLGSCRTSVPHDAENLRIHGVDALRAYALWMAGEDEAVRPTVLLLLGDQVYADEPPPEVRAYIRGRRGDGEEPGEEIADFAEYAELYRVAWTEPAIRWLLSTVPTAMIFDDHDLRDDWNTSDVWRREMRRLPWWRRRVVAGLGAYWLYQHLGNLSPAERAADPLFAALREAEGDGGALLDDFAWTADEDPSRNRWSFARDYGGTRLVVLDSRCARDLGPGRRAMLDAGEWAWFERLATGDVDHLLIGSSVPVLLPTGLHYLESWNEAVCDGVWGRWAARLGERVRQGIDLEHWGAFRRTFSDLAHLVTEIARGRRGRPPATITFLSGDVHYSYLARVNRTPAGTHVQQIVCSPIRNPLSPVLRLGNVVASFALAGVFGRVLARAAGVPRTPFGWRVSRGPWFDNAVATVELRGRSGGVCWWGASDGAGERAGLDLLREERLC